MALRTPLSVTPHLYMGDSTGRPLDMGTVYFGEQDKDPEFYPINLFSDDALTLPLAQPVHTKGGYLYDKGDMVEPHAKEIIYSVKVLDSYGRKVFYKGAMMRNSWNDDVIQQINAAIIESQGAAVVAAEKAVNDAINNTAVEGGILADTFVTKTVNGEGQVARTQRDKNGDFVSVLDYIEDKEQDCTGGFNAALDYLESKGGGALFVPPGVYKFQPSNTGIVMRDNTSIIGLGVVRFELLPYAETHYNIIGIKGVNNIHIENIILDGKRELRYVKGQPEKYYKNINTVDTVEAGQAYYAHFTGYIAKTSGEAPRIPFNSGTGSVGEIKTYGAVQLEIVESSLGEWGHGIAVSQSENVQLTNIKSINNWGDGLTISGGEVWDVNTTPYEEGGEMPYSRHVYLDHIELDNNRRQGISLLSLRDSVWNDVRITNTGGTAPEAAIDYEPERPDECMKNVTINDLYTEGNAVAFWLSTFRELNPNADETTITKFNLNNMGAVHKANTIKKYRDGAKDELKTSVTFNRWHHVAVDSGKPAYSISRTEANEFVKGFVELNDCVFFIEDAGSYERSAVTINQNHAYGIQHYLNNCRFVYRVSNAVNPVHLDWLMDSETLHGGVHIKDCKVVNEGGNVTGTRPYFLSLASYTGEVTVGRFANISFINTEPAYKSSWSANAIFKGGVNSELVENVVFIDNYGLYKQQQYNQTEVSDARYVNSLVMANTTTAWQSLEFNNHKTFQGHTIEVVVPHGAPTNFFFNLTFKNMHIKGLINGTANESGGMYYLRLYAGERVKLKCLDPNHSGSYAVWELSEAPERVIHRWETEGNKTVKYNGTIAAGATVSIDSPLALEKSSSRYAVETSGSMAGVQAQYIRGVSGSISKIELTNLTTSPKTLNVTLNIIYLGSQYP